MGQTHTLTISSDKDYRDFNIEHLTECPSVTNRGFPEWTCAIGWLLDMEGLSEDLMQLPDGEYPVEFWHTSFRNQYGGLEDEYGICLVDTP
jgi:hypothetical protein